MIFLLWLYMEHMTQTAAEMDYRGYSLVDLLLEAK